MIIKMSEVRSGLFAHGMIHEDDYVARDAARQYGQRELRRQPRDSAPRQCFESEMWHVSLPMKRKLLIDFGLKSFPILSEFQPFA